MGQIHRCRGGECDVGGECLSARLLLLLLEERIHARRNGAELVRKRDGKRSEVEWSSLFFR